MFYSTGLIFLVCSVVSLTGWIQDQGHSDGSEACRPQRLQQEAAHEHKETGRPVGLRLVPCTLLCLCTVNIQLYLYSPASKAKCWLSVLFHVWLFVSPLRNILLFLFGDLIVFRFLFVLRVVNLTRSFFVVSSFFPLFICGGSIKWVSKPQKSSSLL